MYSAAYPLGSRGVGEMNMGGTRMIETIISLGGQNLILCCDRLSCEYIAQVCKIEYQEMYQEMYQEIYREMYCVSFVTLQLRAILTCYLIYKTELVAICQHIEVAPTPVEGYTRSRLEPRVYSGPERLRFSTDDTIVGRCQLA